MKTSPIRPKHRLLPEGFVDAIGLDDDSIPFKPFIIRQKRGPDDEDQNPDTND